MRITIITAHPDDAEIFCAGTILAWSSLGAEITLIIMSDGRRGGKVAHKNLVNERSVEAKKAAAMLGIKLIELGLEDGRLSDVEMPYKLVRTHLNEFMPDLVVTHAPKDYHEDHRKTSRFTSAVVNFNFPVLFMEPMMGVGVLPTHYVDISKFQDQKKKQLWCIKPKILYGLLQVHGYKHNFGRLNRGMTAMQKHLSLNQYTPLRTYVIYYRHP